MQTATAKRISVLRIAHVYYQHKDINDVCKFLADFGFVEERRAGERIYFRGYGTEPFVYCAEKADEDMFGGAAFAVASFEDLELAQQLIPSASEIYELDDAPGGGQCVTFHDPVDGFPFHLVYGQSPADPRASFPQLDFNFPNDKKRAVNHFQRFAKGPAPVHKMGHFGVCVTDFAKAYEFYTTKFNFKASDLLHDEAGRQTTAFMHIDLGEELVDHHSFFLFEGPEHHVHHSSFEVHDFDIQVLGHDWLRERGYRNCWGVGRHILGSQIFDYWFDPSGFILEHYVDGDLVNCEAETKLSQASPHGLHIWGPDLPVDFMQ
ncbi:Glyoxalase/Bleomycin resistance protein/Dihydroxybiphenyl dioxygenase [Neofusicoccum parvum]|uniref:Glyoxalase/Bleomycin resistance protein/Dihydroxybiphenyl dioxygenase n=1 Tax=Neofusicoccum parvum TaxID=310453 RepID=A0ACB5S940_9PEZI|nr:Glyoxalase/Bleomycin resistance protein/Dihydroxybiphenyl dioxygenase [Neofusicoccum parvum]